MEPINSILLDTSAYSAFKRGDAEALDLIRAAERILLPAVVIGELLAGFEGGAKRSWNRNELESFCASRRVTIVPLTWTSAERYAVIFQYLRAAGKPAPTNDLWIAAAAMEHGAVIVTAGRHFLFMPQVIAIVLGAAS